VLEFLFDFRPASLRRKEILSMTNFRHHHHENARARLGPRLKTLVRKAALAAAASCLLVFPLGAQQSRLLDLYKTGRIAVEPDPSFGKSTDWGSYIFDVQPDIAVAPDGSIFITNVQEHCILKFDGAGRLVTKFGKKGQGPGDFNGPDNPSILDGRFLVVGEYATNRRISLFNLDGTFHKLLKTRNSTYSVTSLRDNKVAYVSIVHGAPGKTTTPRTFVALIMDVSSGMEKEVARWTTTTDSIQAGRLLITPGENTTGNLLVARSAQGNLLVVNTMAPRIDEYSPEGQKIRSFDLNLTPIPVTKKYIQDYHRRMVRGSKSQNEYETNSLYRESIDQLEKASIDHIFGEHLPLLKEILVDSEGNILVFKHSDCLENCPLVFQVYSPEGKFVGETELVGKDFELSIDPRFKRICFTDRGIFCVVRLRGDELQTPRLVKVATTGTAPQDAARDRP
jgi:hypothetical protein